MEINSLEVISYIECQKKTFEDLMLARDKDEFFRGVIEGMNLVKQYLSLYNDALGASIAKHFGESDLAREINDNINPEDHK